jgi:hypothetical protein
MVGRKTTLKKAWEIAIKKINEDQQKQIFGVLRARHALGIVPP